MSLLHMCGVKEEGVKGSGDVVNSPLKGCWINAREVAYYHRLILIVLDLMMIFPGSNARPME
jgi:hypothetical protein